MWISAIAFCIALAAKWVIPDALNTPSHDLILILVVSGSLILLGTIFLKGVILAPIEHLEQNLIPNLMSLFHRRSSISFCQFFLFLFPLVSFAIAVFLSNLEGRYLEYIFLGWIIFFGISLDCLRHIWFHSTQLLTPANCVNHFLSEAKKAVKSDNDEMLWHNIDNLSETALRAVEKSKLALSLQALQAFPPIMHSFFDSSKSISRVNQDEEIEKRTGRDETSFTIFYLLQRLELIYDKALQNKLETVCRQMVMIMGKIIVYAAKLDLSLVSFPTHFLTKFGLKAQQYHFDEVGVLTTSTLLEIAKTIVNDIDLTYTELQEPVQSIINGLTALAKGTFKKDKTTNIPVLVKPLEDLRALFLQEKMSRHRDTPAILGDIDTALGEFGVLAEMMQVIPSFGGATQEGASLFEPPTNPV
jgi:hypothetical protein